MRPPAALSGSASPTASRCDSGTIATVLWIPRGLPRFSRTSYPWKPARPYPICTSHGQTTSDVASIVMARVERNAGRELNAFSGMRRAISASLAPHLNSDGQTKSDRQRSPRWSASEHSDGADLMSAVAACPRCASRLRVVIDILRRAGRPALQRNAGGRGSTVLRRQYILFPLNGNVTRVHRVTSQESSTRGHPARWQARHR